MVARRKLPGFTALVIFSVFGPVCGVKYCLSGEDNLMNMTCSTGELTPANMMSSKVVGDVPQDSSENEPGPSKPETDYQCMIFQYNETHRWENGVDLITHVNFTCDLHKYCHGFHQDGGMQFRLDGRDGLLFCCNSTDNCNTPSLRTQHSQQQQCYTGGPHIEHEVTVCASVESYCLTVTSSHIVHTGCDVKDICSDLNKDGALNSCHYSEDIQQETCCCKGQLCNDPGPRVETVRVEHTQGSLQTTLLIVIGVTLGVLLMGVAVYMYRRFKQRPPPTPSPSKIQYHSTQYSSVTEDVDDDKVQIIQPDRPIPNSSRKNQPAMEMV